MTAEDILDIIGDARGEYLLEVQAYREMQPEQEDFASIRRISFRRGLLIAAILALTLMLVGCTVVYVLSLQEMKVGEYSFTEPAYINEEGEKIPAEEKTTVLVSLQGIYQPALEEWLAFTDSYDSEGALAAANNRNESEVPEPYHTTYGCYTWEMVHKLDEIIRKYDLKLLEPYILIQHWESDILFDALKIHNIHEETSGAEVTYGAGYFYPEGTFSISADILLPDAEWRYVNSVYIRYSLKEYFDPVYSSVGEIDSYQQWNYTTEGGTTVLLAMNEENAKIYADLEAAFVSIGMNAYGYKGQEKVPMTKEVLQQIADVFDFSIKPQSADLELVKQMQAEAAAQKKAEDAAIQDPIEAVIAEGYEAYLNFRLELVENPDEVRYSLYDLNGDGTEELIIRDRNLYCYEILSEKRGETFLYFDAGAVTANSEIHPCGNGTFLLYSAYGGVDRYEFFQAHSDGVSYLEGVRYDRTKAVWYYLPDSDPWTDNERIINETDARKTIDNHTLGKMDTLGVPKPAEDFSQEERTSAVDPYAAYIADSLKEEGAEELCYTLLDLNNDGVEELLIEGPLYHGSEEIGTCLSIYSQEKAELVNLNIVVVQHVCKGNVLEYCRIEENGAEYHEYYQLNGIGMKTLDIIEYDPRTDTWTWDIDGYWGDPAKVIPKAEAQQIITSYKRIDLDWKPLEEYPLN